MLRGRLGILYGLSFALHAGVAFAVVSIHPQEAHEATRITMREHKQKPDKEKTPPPPPPPAIVAPKPVRRAAPKPVEAAPEPAPAPTAAAAPAASSAAPVADFGLSMMGNSGGGSIAVPVGPRPAGPARVTKTVTPKALAKAPEADSCLEQLVKPKPISVPQPVYADAARAAGITGKVRVELTVDETGAVVAVKVIEGLGYGLDEAALEAARNARFEAATRCGKPARTTFTIGIRFSI